MLAEPIIDNRGEKYNPLAPAPRGQNFNKILKLISLKILRK